MKEMQATAADDGEIKCMVLTAENNACAATGCITDCIAAVNIPTSREEDMDDWMIAGINTMLDKVQGRRKIMVATTAFGMGINVPDIELVLHFNTPISMVDYIPLPST